MTLRLALFVCGCLGTRSALVVLARARPDLLPLLGLLAVVPAIGFAVIYAGGLRQTGPEVFGERIWWNDLRPVHAALYATFAVMALRGNESAWIVLLADVLLGLAAFVHHRYTG